MQPLHCPVRGTLVFLERVPGGTGVVPGREMREGGECVPWTLMGCWLHPPRVGAENTRRELGEIPAHFCPEEELEAWPVQATPEHPSHPACPAQGCHLCHLRRSPSPRRSGTGLKGPGGRVQASPSSWLSRLFTSASRCSTVFSTVWGKRDGNRVGRGRGHEWCPVLLSQEHLVCSGERTGCQGTWALLVQSLPCPPPSSLNDKILGPPLWGCSWHGFFSVIGSVTRIPSLFQGLHHGSSHSFCCLAPWWQLCQMTSLGF